MSLHRYSFNLNCDPSVTPSIHSCMFDATPSLYYFVALSILMMSLYGVTRSSRDRAYGVTQSSLRRVNSITLSSLYRAYGVTISSLRQAYCVELLSCRVTHLAPRRAHCVTLVSLLQPRATESAAHPSNAGQAEELRRRAAEEVDSELPPPLPTRHTPHQDDSAEAMA
jgi:hypothetical protein